MEIIQTYLIEHPVFNIDGLIKYIYSQIPRKLYHHRLHYKKYSEHNLIQLFTESSQEYTNNSIFDACRSIIFDTVNNKIVSFSHPNLEYVSENQEIRLSEAKNSFTESHEGTLICVFYHNDKWFYATRREIDMYKTHKITHDSKSELSHGLMFEDALLKLNLTKEDFESNLNKDHQYYIELVHYQNAININYSRRFGDNYAKLFLLFVRIGLNIVENENIVGLESNPVLDLETVKYQLTNQDAIVEGYIYESSHLCKLVHPLYYEKMKFNPGYRVPQEQYIYLYQKDLLLEYATKNNKIVFKTTEFGENVELVGMLSCIFTYISQRMLDVYYTFNNNKMEHKNEELFVKLFQNNHKYYLIFHILGMMKGIHKHTQINIIEMKKLLKYKLVASDIWKLFNELKMFEETENILAPWTNPLVKMF